MKEDIYQPRIYRHWIDGKDLVSFTVKIKETDLYIRAASDLHRKAGRITRKYRDQIEGYIAKSPVFQSSLESVPMVDFAPDIIKEMIKAGIAAGVGPMAAVAGAIAESVGKELLGYSPEIIVENGGDIFMKILKKRVVGIFAGDSPLTGKLGIELNAGDTPLGICTSSGMVGHSLSFGTADAVVVLSASTALADAAATAIGNQVKEVTDIDRALEFAGTIKDLKGLLIIKGEKLGAWGEVKVCNTTV
jgi:ApbE superfamily uncharacterized protein (UPF0280 family)